MRLEDHIALASEFLKQGLVDIDTYYAVLEELRRIRGLTPIELWVTSGRVTADQLSAALSNGGRVFPKPNLPLLRDSGQSSSAGREPTVVSGRMPPLDKSKPTTGTTAETDTRVVTGQLTSAPMALRGDRYISPGLLGVGGLGEVRSYVDSILRRTVAMKLTKDGVDESAKEILAREARIVASLEHPNIIPVYDAGILPDIGPFYVMRLINEPSLAEVLERLVAGDEETSHEYSAKRLLRFFVQICRAIEYANQRGVIHCDIKPHNIMLGKFGQVLIVDWGLAFSEEWPGGPRGGTPGYMAPEQLDYGQQNIDGRTDVFALGAVLHHIVSRKPAVRSAATKLKVLTSEGLLELYREVEAPSKASPELDIAPELDDICHRAMQLDPAERYQSAGALAKDVESFLEGRKELERLRREANESVALGDDLAERYHEMIESRELHLTALRGQIRVTPPWTEPSAKSELWDAEDVIKVTDNLRARMLQAAISAYEQALEAVSTDVSGRAGLAKLYNSELHRARFERNAVDQIHYQRLLEQYDDGTFVSAAKSAKVSMVIAEGVQVTIFAIQEEERRLVSSARGIVPSNGSCDLQPGTYIALATRDETEARYPIVIEAGQELQLEIALPSADELDQGEVFVAGGSAILGGSDVHQVRTPREVHVPPFTICRLPVTFREYLDFIAYVRIGDPELAARHLPRTILGSPRWAERDGAWQATGFGEEGALDEMLDLPVFGVSADDARAYAKWLSEGSDRSYRLPRDSEWEKAARGVDGRTYPWGNEFDSTFCKMRDSRPGMSKPEPAGTFEADESPYGVRDLAGGVADWVEADTNAAVYRSDDHKPVFSRGGAWCDWQEDCRVTSRRTYLSKEVSARVGFRIARDL